MTKRKRTALLVTYNSVEGYEPGTYRGKNWNITIHSHENMSGWGTKAGGKLDELLSTLPQKRLDRAYVYAGINALTGAIEAAETLKERGAETYLVACGCGSDYKREAANAAGLPLLWTECGGRQGMKDIADRLLG